jgi:hypothetical protein
MCACTTLWLVVMYPGSLWLRWSINQQPTGAGAAHAPRELLLAPHSTPCGYVFELGAEQLTGCGLDMGADVVHLFVAAAAQ